MLLIYRIGNTFFSKETAVLSILFFFIFPIHYYYCLGVLAEAPAFFSMTLALYGWSKIYQQKNQKNGWIIFGIATWFLIQNRPNTLLIIPLGIAIAVLSFFRNKDFYKSYGRKIIFSLLSVGLLSFGTLTIVKKVTNTKSEKKQEDLFFYVAHQGRFQFREEPLDLRYWESDVRPDSKDYQNWIKNSQRLDSLSKSPQTTYGEVYKQFLIDDFFEHPELFARQFFVKCFYGHIYVINSIQPQKFNLFIFKGVTGYWIFVILVNLINIIIVIGLFIFLFNS